MKSVRRKRGSGPSRLAHQGESILVRQRKRKSGKKQNLASWSRTTQSLAERPHQGCSRSEAERDTAKESSSDAVAMSAYISPPTQHHHAFPYPSQKPNFAHSSNGRLGQERQWTHEPYRKALPNKEANLSLNHALLAEINLTTPDREQRKLSLQRLQEQAKILESEAGYDMMLQDRLITDQVHELLEPRPVRCSGTDPCTRCVKQKRICVFSRIEKKRKIATSLQDLHTVDGLQNYRSMYGFDGRFQSGSVKRSSSSSPSFGHNYDGNRSPAESSNASIETARASSLGTEIVGDGLRIPLGRQRNAIPILRSKTGFGFAHIQARIASFISGPISTNLTSSNNLQVLPSFHSVSQGRYGDLLQHPPPSHHPNTFDGRQELAPRPPPPAFYPDSQKALNNDEAFSNRFPRRQTYQTHLVLHPLQQPLQSHHQPQHHQFTYEMVNEPFGVRRLKLEQDSCTNDERGPSEVDNGQGGNSGKSAPSSQRDSSIYDGSYTPMSSPLTPLTPVSVEKANCEGNRTI
ncbi:hypothetical protein IE53DRAFT_368379 [Violaceomyces palustris]|uniref:Uncharacterized protein n=1 Tax=Violaceomyces palustris TaxID=1673888 RepID=A0ACD0NZB6_9BASI|nr:hypothetical protein IE53DRAFT_368379 [Violaceomyces palustris]